MSSSSASIGSASSTKPGDGLTLAWSGKETVSPYAYVLSVFKDANYLLGALVTAFSLKATKTQNDVVLLATDVPEDMMKLARRVFDRIYQVPYLRLHCRPLRTEKQRERYGSWMDVSCTKWNCLGLTAYRKVMFLDADKLVLASLDALFELPTPAGTFSSPQARGYCERGGMYNPYLELKEGQKVDDRMVMEGLTGTRGPSFTVIGTAVVLSPNRDHYEEMIRMLGQYTLGRRFGYESCNSSIDEQVLTHFYSQHLPAVRNERSAWTYVSQRHGWIPWNRSWLRPFERPPTVLHYFGRKFWALDRGEWLDLEVLWSVIQAMIENWPEESEKNRLSELYGRKQLSQAPSPGCFYCKLFGHGTWREHAFIKRVDVTCPVYLSELTGLRKA
jgi:hypothetical protein